MHSATETKERISQDVEEENHTVRMGKIYEVNENAKNSIHCGLIMILIVFLSLFSVYVIFLRNFYVFIVLSSTEERLTLRILAYNRNIYLIRNSTNCQPRKFSQFCARHLKLAFVFQKTEQLRSPEHTLGLTYARFTWNALCPIFSLKHRERIYG